MFKFYWIRNLLNTCMMDNSHKSLAPLTGSDNYLGNGKSKLSCFTGGGVLISLSQAIEPVGEYTIAIATRPQVLKCWSAQAWITQFLRCNYTTLPLPPSYFLGYFLAIEHHHPLAGTKLHCLVIEAHVCEQLAHGRYIIVGQPKVEPATSWLQVQRLNHYYTTTTYIKFDDYGCYIMSCFVKAQCARLAQYHSSSATLGCFSMIE